MRRGAARAIALYRRRPDTPATARRPAYVTKKYGVTLDAALTPVQRTTNLLVTRTLDDDRATSYSRWKDERYWSGIRDALKREHPALTDDGLMRAKEYNAQRYYFQGIGRFEPDEAGHGRRGSPISAPSQA